MSQENLETVRQLSENFNALMPGELSGEPTQYCGRAQRIRTMNPPIESFPYCPLEVC
jgi:hypothetical protein